jgi:hypothetical protein
VRRRVLRGMLLVGAILALSGSASAADSAAPAEPAKPAVYPGAEDAGHIGCGEPALTQLSTADAR